MVAAAFKILFITINVTNGLRHNSDTAHWTATEHRYTNPERLHTVYRHKTVHSNGVSGV
jgi:hypothetical protein